MSVPDESGIDARLVSLNDTFRFEFRGEQSVDIGRHPDCQIVVKDPRVSGRHCRIFREGGHWFVEELSANGLFINEHFMKKGDTRSLKHGDTVSVCVYAHDATQTPFAAYNFLIVGDLPTASVRDSRAQVSTGPGPVSEEWVRSKWDMRTPLGSGNFSTVYLGVKVEDGSKRFAVKAIDKNKFNEFQSKRESHLSLSSEAEVLTSLHHPGIVHFEEWFETTTKLYLVMEFVSGGDLLKFILESGCFEEMQAHRLFHDLCDAVQYLHSKNIVHRDLKPENVLLTTTDVSKMRLKIADFGLARKNMKSQDCRTFCGTPHYFAPEVINTLQQDQDQPSGYGKQADMWSLGVILYIMLCGIPPFEEERLFEQILGGKYEFDSSEWISVSLEAKDLVSRLMTVNPKDRLAVDQALAHKWFVGPALLRRTSSSPDEPQFKKQRADKNANITQDFSGLFGCADCDDDF